MIVKNKDWVGVLYEGKLENNEVFDKNDEKHPLYFQVGSKMVIPGFDKAVEGMKVGDEKTVTIKAKEAYGEKSTEVVDIPKEAFAGQDLSKIEQNKEFQIMSNMGPLLIEIKSFDDKTIKAIVNHPLQGKELTFKIKLLKILDEKEVADLQKEMQEHHQHHHEHHHEHN